MKEQLELLPALWATEGTETDALVLGVRIECAWHRLAWYPIEYDRELGVLYGFTTRTVPEWRHFHISELAASYGGEMVRLDTRFVGGRVPLVPEILLHKLDDITAFRPATLPDIGLDK